MEFLIMLSNAFSGTPLVAVSAALGLGFASIWMSPCHLAGVPLVVGYLTASPDSQVQHHQAAVILFFALGTLLSLIPLGVVTLLLGRIAGDLGISSNYLVALMCVVAGLYLLGWLPLSWSGRGLPQLVSRGPWQALTLGLVFGLALGPCAFAWIAPLLGVVWLQAADGLVLPTLLMAAFAVGHCAGVLLAAGSLDRVQRWLNALGKGSGAAFGRDACGTLLLLAALFLILGME